jgi:hypothetical protein
VVGVTLVILIVARAPNPPLQSSFERAARGALGPSTQIELVTLPEDPPDEESAARTADGHVDGVVELSWTSEEQARLHCYVAREQRWVDREITFDKSRTGSLRETSERGRLLGFAVATMFAPEQLEAEPEVTHEKDRGAPPIVPPASPASPTSPTSPADKQAPLPTDAPAERAVEFAGVISSGLGDGTASGIGANAAVRLAWLGPVSTRFFLSGRAGSIAQAQATTRTVLGGAGLALAVMPSERMLQLGARLDAFVSYFAASHLSEDDVVPDTQSRWLPGAGLLAEAGLRFPGGVGLFLGAGLEAMAGSTYVYTHGKRVAVVPPLRAVGELGLRAPF